MLGIKSMWGDAATHLTLFCESRRCRHGYRPKNKHNCMHSSGFLFGRATASWKPGPIWELRIKSRLKRRDCCTQRWETRGELLLNSPWLSVWILWVLKIGVKCILLWLFIPACGHQLEAWRKRNVINGAFLDLSEASSSPQTPKCVL